MLHALTLAERAERDGEVPIGAVLTVNDELLAAGWNQPVGSNDPTGHAEIIALRAAAVRLKNYRLVGATLYVTLEPCPMCAGAIVQARVGRVVYGASDPQSGAAGSAFNLLAASELNHRPEVVGGALADLCSKRLRVFFEARR
jgi:tRNA(adenine34) deaminase